MPRSFGINAGTARTHSADEIPNKFIVFHNFGGVTLQNCHFVQVCVVKSARFGPTPNITHCSERILNKKRKQTWLKVSFNQVFFPTSPLGSEFTRISYDITKVDPKYQVHPQTLNKGGLKFAFLSDRVANPLSFEVITTYDEIQGLNFSQINPQIYADFLDNASFPKHAFQDPRPNKNWVSSQATRKILVVQMCGADLEDQTAAIDPALNYKPHILASSNPILIELSEDVAPALGGK